MKNKQKKPSVPPIRHETIRREILTVLTDGACTAKEISSQIRISEKEVYDHLDHIRKSLGRPGPHLVITPAECKKCGFVFANREHLKKPGRCPLCRGESIREPSFAVEQRA